MIDPDIPVPLFQQLADIIRDKVRSGELPGRVPSIRTLSQEYRVSTKTAERALGLLAHEGLLVVLAGKGYYVRPQGKE